MGNAARDLTPDDRAQEGGGSMWPRIANPANYRYTSTSVLEKDINQGAFLTPQHSFCISKLHIIKQFLSP